MELNTTSRQINVLFKMAEVNKHYLLAAALNALRRERSLKKIKKEIKKD